MSKQSDLINVTDAITVDGSNKVGIGTGSPQEKLHVLGSAKLDFGSAGGNPRLYFDHDTVTDDANYIQLNRGDAGLEIISEDNLKFDTNGSEAMRIDSSGNLLVGTTDPIAYSTSTTSGAGLKSTGVVFGSVAGNAAIFNRRTTDGTIINLRKDGSSVGSIGVDDNAGTGKTIYICSDNSNGSVDVGLKFDWDTNQITPCREDGISRDNAIDLGGTSNRFDDIYATNGTIQTSDRNEKQDIDVLSDAEQRVAVACKGLLRKFRWKDSVDEKGDDARIHFGIIAQDLQDAFTAEGLDAGRYAMFISTTWRETQTDVPAVEADEENGIEAKDAYTRTDTYETLEEAPEGATERTRLGVRYPELLAFIIGAT